MNRRQLRNMGFGAFGLIVIGSILTPFFFQKERSMNELTLRVGYPSSASVSEYDTAKITFDYQYNLLHSLFSTVVEENQQGELISGIAQTFSWKNGGEAHLRIRKDLRTVDGFLITPEDVVFSLKRLLVLKTNSHADLNSLFCQKNEMLSVDSPCDDISVVGDEVVIKLKDQRFYFWNLLANLDYGIIPKRSVDHKTLQIIDWRNTTGPYFVESEGKPGEITLKANPNHYLYRKDMPQTVIISPLLAGPDETEKTFEERKIDHITLYGPLQSQRVIGLHERLRDGTDVHATMNVNVHFYQFTSVGYYELTPDRRRHLSKKTHEAHREWLEENPRLGLETTYSFLPALGHGALTPQTETELKRRFAESDASTETGSGIVVGVGPGWGEIFQGIFRRKLPDLRVIEIPVTDDLPVEKYGKIHLTLSSVDVSPTEEVGGISYQVKNGYYPLFGDDRTEWLEKYVNTNDYNSRSAMLRDLHFRALVDDPTIIPVVSGYYAAIVRKPWKMNFPRFSPINAFHWITHE